MGTALVSAIVFLVIAIVVGALIVQLATKLAAGFKPTLGNAVVTVIVGIIAGIVVKIVLGMVLSGGTGSLLGIVVAFLVNAAVINFMIKQPSGGQMGFGKACLVSLLQYIIYIVLSVILVVVFGTAMFSMLGGVH